MDEQISMLTATEDESWPKPCPFCGSASRLDLSFREALNKKTRYGRYDAAIYCRKCYAYGPRVKSEDLDAQPIDPGAGLTKLNLQNNMKEAAIRQWNRRISNE